jgi:hypothetical protein
VGLAEAEAMYQRALAGYEKVLGSGHTSTLETVFFWVISQTLFQE